MKKIMTGNRILVLILSVAFLLYLAMLTPGRFGAYYDDGLFVAAAKSLATGHGYRTISLPQENPQTVIPPFYPLLLSLIWKIVPQFPANLSWMMIMSAISTVFFLFLGYMYLLRNGYATRWQALIVLAFAGINWRTMLLATNIMSDMSYAALSIAALHLAEKNERGKGDRTLGVVLGTAIGFAYLTRSSGIALLIALIMYALFRRQWHRVLIPVGTASIFILAWVGWVYMNSSSTQGVNAVYYSNYLKGSSDAIASLATLNETSILNTLLKITGTNLLLLCVGSIPLACLGLRYDLPPFILIPFVMFTLIMIVAAAIRQFRSGARLPHVYLVVYLALHLVVPGSAYDRYIIPVIPILLLLLVTELTVPIRLLLGEFIRGRHKLGKLAAIFIGSVLAVFIGGVSYSNLLGIYDSLGSTRAVQERAPENSKALEWIRANTATSDIIACYRDPICYLYTGRKAVLSFPLVLLNTIPYHSRQLTFEEQAEPFLEIIKTSGARYLLLNSDDFMYESAPYRDAIEQLIAGHPRRFIPVFISTSGLSTIYRIEGGGDGF